VTIAGTPLVQLVEAVATLFLLDDFVEPAAFRMTPDGDPAFVADVHREVKGALMRVGARDIVVAPLERAASYVAARESFARRCHDRCRGVRVLPAHERRRDRLCRRVGPAARTPPVLRSRRGQNLVDRHELEDDQDA
jgi:hypothetical protein